MTTLLRHASFCTTETSHDQGENEVSWSETDALNDDRQVAAIERATAERIERARVYGEWAVRQGRTDIAGAQAWVADVTARAFTARDEALAALHVSTLTVVPDVETDDCASGSCQLARPGGPCDCACGGREHGVRSTLSPAACGGTKVLTDLADGGGYRFSQCPGCSGCVRRPLLVVGTAGQRDPFAGLPQVDDELDTASRPGLAAITFDSDGWPVA